MTQRATACEVSWAFKPRGCKQGVRRAAGGSIMVHAIAGLVMLMFLSLTLLMLSRAMVGHSVRRARELRALSAAEAACSRGIAMLESGAVRSVPYREQNIPLGPQRMDLEIVQVGTGTAGAYGTVTYEVRGTGRAGNVARQVALGASQESFLSFSRFLETGTLAYDAGATLTGKVYSGGDLSLSASPVTFCDDVDVVGRIINKSYGIYRKRVTEGATRIALSGTMDPSYYRTLAQAAGLYYSSGTPEINLTLFDFTQNPPRYNGQPLSSQFNGIIFSEGDLAVNGVLEGRSLTLVANGNINVTDNVRTGTTRRSFRALSPSLTLNAAANKETVVTVPLTSLMSEVSNSVTMKVSGGKWQRLNIYVYEDSRLLGVETLERPTNNTANLSRTTILSGLQMDPAKHSYRAQVHYWSNGAGETKLDLAIAAGDPVNVALIAKSNVYLSQYTPRVLRIDAALFARDGNWRPIDYTDSTDSDKSHWACNGVYDLDEDGVIETNNEDGWNETAVNSSTWMLTINGPIITKDGGSAGAWSYYGGLTGKGTRRYDYDNDIVYYQPPSFPIMLSRWAVAYWREV